MPRAYWVAGLAVAGLAAVAVAVSAGHEPAAGSTLSRASGGWMAARRYVEARGGRATLVDSPSVPTEGVLVLVFPWQRIEPPATGDRMADRHLAGGGTVVFAYSGRSSWNEPAIAEHLGMAHDGAPGSETGERPPLHPSRWREYAASTSTLSAEPAHGLAPLLAATPRARPRPPAGATILFRDAEGRPAVFSFRRHGGRVVALPAAVLSNAFLGSAGNADLLESLLAAHGGEWAFDEYHHGLAAPSEPAAESAAGPALDLILLQLALVYALGVVAVSRRFGPVWGEPPVVVGSTTSFLRGLGTLHHRLGHHRDAAELLVARARELDPRLRIPDASPADGGPQGLLRLAQAIGRAQSGEETR
jgi:hypothetical protein